MTDDPAADDDLANHLTAEFWDERYASSTRLWSGEPNPRLVEHVTGLRPGTAIDVGCGEGADAVWLARQGWRVTGVDVSRVAVERAAAHAAEAGVGDRADFAVVDVVSGDALPGPVDLVTAHYLHAPPRAFATAIAAMAGAVVPGGTLLVVGHHPDDEHTGLRNPQLTSLLFTPEQVLAHLDEHWEIRLAEVETRVARHGDHEVTVSDTVVQAVRT